MANTPSLLSTDMVVVGAGPAGCTTAKTAAELGADVLLLEEHPIPGTPVFCGEGITVKTLVDAGLKPEPPLINEPIMKANIYSPNGKRVTITKGRVLGYTINRNVFDELLAKNAVAAGVRLMVNTCVREVTKNNGVVVGVKAVNRIDGEHFNIKSKIVIGADGHASIIRRSALATPYFKSFGVCAQYTLSGLNIQEPDAIEIWLSRKYAPGSYAWVFPKSRTVANVGVSIRAKQATKPAILYLQDFISQSPRLRQGTMIYKTGGICPFTGTLDKIVDDGVMLVGDAAGQIIPMTGAGIGSAISAGIIAGSVAAKAIQGDNTSKAVLEEYSKTFNSRWDKVIKGSKKMLDLFDDLNDKDLNTLFEIIKPKQVQTLANGNKVTRTLISIAFKAPRLTLKILAKL